MSYEEYWNGDPWLVCFYREMHRMRNEQKNQEMWIQGLYFYDALSVVMQNSFGKGKKEKYTEKPFQIYPKTEAEKEREDAIARKKLVAQLNAWQKNWERKHGKQNDNR